MDICVHEQCAKKHVQKFVYVNSKVIGFVTLLILQLYYKYTVDGTIIGVPVATYVDENIF